MLEQRPVHQFERRKCVHRHMLRRGEGGGLRLPRREGVPRPRYRGQRVVEQLGLPDVGSLDRRPFDIDDEMAAGVAQRVDRLVAAVWGPGDVHAGRKRLKPLPQRLDQDQLARLARRCGKLAHGKRGIEGFARPEQAFHTGEDDVNRGRKLQRLGRRHQALARPHEQLVGENFAEFGQCMADGRGAAPQPFGRAGDARVHQERVQRHEKIGVDLFEMHEIQLFF